MNMEGILFNHIHHALDQVRELRARVIENQLFQGYSGSARALGGLTALLAAAVMSLPFYPDTVFAHMFGWGLVAFIAAFLNYSALGVWYSRLEEREPLMLRPAIDALPPLVVGGILTAMLHTHGLHNLLFVVWMCLFGLVNMASRRSLPIAVWYLGFYYISCGTLLAVTIPNNEFTNPWPMAIVFCVGEILGGYILRRQDSD